MILKWKGLARDGDFGSVEDGGWGVVGMHHIDVLASGWQLYFRLKWLILHAIGVRLFDPWAVVS